VGFNRRLIKRAYTKGQGRRRKRNGEDLKTIRDLYVGERRRSRGTILIGVTKKTGEGGSTGREVIYEVWGGGSVWQKIGEAGD